MIILEFIKYFILFFLVWNLLNFRLIMEQLLTMIRNVEYLADTDRNLDFQISAVRLMIVIMRFLSVTLDYARDTHESNEHYAELSANVSRITRHLEHYHQYLTEEEVLISFYV